MCPHLGGNTFFSKELNFRSFQISKDKKNTPGRNLNPVVEGVASVDKIVGG
jgi:hypothetical protein